MATIQFTIGAAALTRTVAAYCGLYNYDQDKLPDETQAQFAKRMQIRQIKQTVARWEASEAGRVATTEAHEAAMSEVDLT